MLFKEKIKKLGNEAISVKAKNPYYIPTNHKSSFPLWAKISIPSSIVSIGAVVAVIISMSFLPEKSMLEKYALNHPKKSFNSSKEPLAEGYLDSLNSYALDVYNSIAKLNAFYISNGITNDSRYQNILFSPFSLMNTQLMLYEGASGITKEMLASQIHIEDGVDYRIETKKALLNTSIDYVNEATGDLLYSNASNVLIENNSDYQVLDEYIDVLSNYYYADVYRTNLSGHELSMLYSEIVAEKTRTKKEYDPRDYFIDNSDRWLFLALAHFESAWKCMLVDQSVYTSFNNVDGTSSPIMKFLTIYGEMNVIEEDDFYMVEVPLLEGFSYNILTAKDDDNCIEVLNNHVGDLLNNKYLEKNRVPVVLSIPEFEINQSTSFPGMATGGYFENMIGNYEKLDVDCTPSSFGNAHLQLTKNGIIASSGTTTYIMDCLEKTGHVVNGELNLCLDHPFLFSITLDGSLPLILGRLDTWR